MAMVTVNAIVNAATPTITTQPQGSTVNVGTNAELSVWASADDYGTLSYQWYKNTTNSNTGGTMVGTNSSSYTPSTATAGTYYYYVVVTNTNNSVNGTKTATTKSNVATVTVNMPTAVETQGVASLQIYPNPVVNGQLIIDIGQLKAGDVISVYSVNGALVLTGNISGGSGTTLNLSHLSQGTYIVKIGNKAAKVVKQ
jgi:hypothetical protein